MPGQLLPLLRSSRRASILYRALPFALQNPVLSSDHRSAVRARNESYGRDFSTLPARSRTDFSGGGGFRDHRRGNPRAGGTAAGAKSLIDDEAELSDWVSDLKTDSLKLNLSSDSDDGFDRGRERSQSFRGRGRDGNRGRGRGRDRDRDQTLSVRDRGFSRKPMDGGSDGFSERRGVGYSARNTRHSVSKRQFGSESEVDDDDDDFPTRQTRGRGNRGGISSMRRGGISSTSTRKEGRNLDSVGRNGRSVRKPLFGVSEEEDDEDDDDEDEDDDFPKRQRGRGNRGGISSSSVRRGGISSTSVRKEGRNLDSVSRDGRSVRKPLFGVSEDDGEDDDEEDEDDDFPTRQRGRGNRGKIFSSSVRRGGISSTSVWKEGRNLDLASGDVLSVKKTLFEVSEKEDDGEDDVSVSGTEEDFFGDKDDEIKGALKVAAQSTVFPASVKGDSVEPATKCSGGETDSYLSQTRFDECSLSPLSLKGIKAAGYERMTIVQEATLPVILKGKDVLAKARTGTGKTIAFLLPAIEVVAKLPPFDHDQKRPPISVLIICPTRELAAQAASEADILLKYHPSIGAQVVTGGTRLALEQKRMQTNPCQILVATPGRLRDHLENTPGFSTRLMGVKGLVLDEADRLLDMGFRRDIEKIVSAIPKQRQTLLFSATVPEEVRQVCYIAMKRDHEFVNTVEEGSEETHSQVRQMHLVAPLEKHFSILYGILTEHISEDVDYKVIVFCTTAMVTKLVADLLSELKLNVREIHSRKPQSYRTRVSKEFKESKGLILVSSDVSARGVDYPNVTLVIQVGVPADREQYIHRLGRTGRKGKEGKGILLLAPWEGDFLNSIKDLPIDNSPLPPNDPDTRKKVERALAHVEMKTKESAYQAWLGYYNSNKSVGRDKCKLVALGNEFSQSIGLDNPPALPKLIIRKMGLNNVPGLRAK